MNWDPFQRAVLAELGHVVYRHASSPAVASAAAQVAAAPVDDPMLARVARAAGLDVQTLQARIGNTETLTGLRGNAAGKRALWPILRALRRLHG